MPIPYMGSKRKAAQLIYQTIINFNPNGKILVDLFCGGFAISEKFLRNGWKVISNDKNIYVVELLRKTIFEKLPEKKVTKFVTREMFIDVQKNPDKYDKWFVGFVQCCYSFGNNQRSYLFGKDVEPIKKAGHELVINKNPDLVKGLIPDRYIEQILKQTDWHKRRIALVKVSKILENRKFELEQLQQLQQLQQLERLQQLEQLERLERLELYSEDYKVVKIPKDAIVYCDPPYNGVTEYKEGSFNHVEFWEWVRKISKKNKIYISEYSAPSDFKALLTYTQKSTLQGGTQKHNEQPKENIFIPIGQEKFKTIHNEKD